MWRLRSAVQLSSDKFELGELTDLIPSWILLCNPICFKEGNENGIWCYISGALNWNTIGSTGCKRKLRNRNLGRCEQQETWPKGKRFYLKEKRVLKVYNPCFVTRNLRHGITQRVSLNSSKYKHLTGKKKALSYCSIYQLCQICPYQSLANRRRRLSLGTP